MKFPNGTYVLDWTNLKYNFQEGKAISDSADNKKAELIVQLVTLLCISHSRRPHDKCPVMEVTDTELFHVLLDSFSDVLEDVDIFSGGLYRVQYEILQGPRGVSLTLQRNDKSTVLVLLLMNLKDITDVVITATEKIYAKAVVHSERIRKEITRDRIISALRITHEIVFNPGK